MKRYPEMTFITRALRLLSGSKSAKFVIQCAANDAFVALEARLRAANKRGGRKAEK